MNTYTHMKEKDTEQFVVNKKDVEKIIVQGLSEPTRRWETKNRMNSSSGFLKEHSTGRNSMCPDIVARRGPLVHLGCPDRLAPK